MNIRKGNPEDMKSVLGLIQELAIFEKEPEEIGRASCRERVCDSV